MGCFFAVLLLVVLSLLFFSEQNTSKDIPESVRVAVIDAEKLKSSAICFQAHKTIADMLNDVILRMKDSESEMKAEYDKVKQNAKLTPRQRSASIANIENKWSAISSKYNAEVQEIKNKDMRLAQILENRLNKVVSDLSKSLKVNLVLNKETKETIIVFYNSNRIDITDKVIRELNKRIPTSNLKEILNG